MLVLTGRSVKNSGLPQEISRAWIGRRRKGGKGEKGREEEEEGRREGGNGGEGGREREMEGWSEGGRPPAARLSLPLPHLAQWSVHNTNKE